MTAWLRVWPYNRVTECHRVHWQEPTRVLQVVEIATRCNRRPHALYAESRGRGDVWASRGAPTSGAADAAPTRRRDAAELLGS